MGEFRMASCRTDGMAPSDIKSGLEDGTLQLCPYRKLRSDQVDEILDGFLHRGISPKENPPRCVSILALGQRYNGMPLARIEITAKTPPQLATAAVCTYCPGADSTCFIHGLDLREALEDDPLWNADIFDDEDGD